MKITQKVLLMLFIIACVLIFMPRNVSFAATAYGSGGGMGSSSTTTNTTTSNAKSALQGLDGKLTTTADVSGLQGLIGNLVGFLQIASGLVAVFMIAFTGFNYIVGTPELKNEMKAKMLPIIVGLILVFGAVSIAKFILGAVGGGGADI